MSEGPGNDHYLTTTQILPKPQFFICLPVHIAFFNVIIDIRKPPKELFLWRFWMRRLKSIFYVAADLFRIS